MSHVCVFVAKFKSATKKFITLLIIPRGFESFLQKVAVWVVRCCCFFVRMWVNNNFNPTIAFLFVHSSPSSVYPNNFVLYNNPIQREQSYSNHALQHFWLHFFPQINTQSQWHARTYTRLSRTFVVAENLFSDNTSEDCVTELGVETSWAEFKPNFLTTPICLTHTFRQTKSEVFLSCDERNGGKEEKKTISRKPIERKKKIQIQIPVKAFPMRSESETFQRLLSFSVKIVSFSFLFHCRFTSPAMLLLMSSSTF